MSEVTVVTTETTKYDTPNLLGRERIYCNYDYVDESNLKEVLTDALITHQKNANEMAYLLKFEKGFQPLVRKKTVRKDIDIVSTANLANEITEFKLGYVWGNGVAIVQKDDKLPTSDKDADNDGVNKLNSYYFAEETETKDQETGRYVEICGVGYQMIDIKRDRTVYDSPFDVINLNPLYTFIVYSSDVRHRKLMGVTYAEKPNGEITYTCITPQKVFILNQGLEVVNGETKERWWFGERSGEKNPLGVVYIIEFDRSADLTGCFERCVAELNALNVLESDLVNDVAQNTQAIWWGNDLELPMDESGEYKGVQAGQWVLTNTGGNGTKPDVKPLILTYDYAGVINNITTKHDYILERCFVPKQSEPGGGSTGTAMSMSSGWLAAEQSAQKETAILKSSYQERNKIALIATNVVEVLKVWPSDIDIRFPRQKTFDMATKVNSLATMLNSGVNPRIAMETVDLFPDLSEAVATSVEIMDKLQKKLIGEGEQAQIERIQQDSSDQYGNSPSAKL